MDVPGGEGVARAVLQQNRRSAPEMMISDGNQAESAVLLHRK